jgi:hypothetical protein
MKILPDSENPAHAGIGCNDDARTLNDVEGKSHSLHACIWFRRLLGQSERHLDLYCDVVHGDGAERKFDGSVGKLEDQSEVINRFLDRAESRAEFCKQHRSADTPGDGQEIAALAAAPAEGSQGSIGTEIEAL